MNEWKYLLEPNNRGEYVTINEDDGRIVVCRRIGNIMPTPSKTSVASVRWKLFKGYKVDEWFMKIYRKWENEFAKNNPDQYNKLINLLS